MPVHIVKQHLLEVAASGDWRLLSTCCWTFNAGSYSLSCNCSIT